MTSCLICFFNQFNLFSKTDENTAEDKLAFLLCSHEYFHQSFTLADCTNQLFRDTSRGIDGGLFFLATLLHRKEAKTGQGKDSIDSLKDFTILRAETRFNHYFCKKYEMDPEKDNTPVHIRKCSSAEKIAYVHSLVAEALKDLLPLFRDCSLEDPLLEDHPLQDGRRMESTSSFSEQESRTSPARSSMGPPTSVHTDVINQTVEQVHQFNAEEYIEKIHVSMSSKRSSKMFLCGLCSNFQHKLSTVVKAHVSTCYWSSQLMHSNDSSEEAAPPSEVHQLNENSVDMKEPDDFLWNYWSCLFLMDSLFCISSCFENFGDGLGNYIINKILLPIFHGLRHSNYSNSIHR